MVEDEIVGVEKVVKSLCFQLHPILKIFAPDIFRNRVPHQRTGPEKG